MRFAEQETLFRRWKAPTRFTSLRLVGDCGNNCNDSSWDNDNIYITSYNNNNNNNNNNNSDKMIMLWWTTRCFWSSFIPLTVTESEIFLHLNSVGLQSFRFGPEIAYVASCVLDVLKGVRNKTLVGGAKKGKYNTFILEIIKISRVICMINTPSEPKRQVVLASMFILLPPISIINFNLGLYCLLSLVSETFATFSINLNGSLCYLIFVL